MNIILTGSTGFLGKRLLDFFADSPEDNVFCPSSADFDLRHLHACRAIFDAFPHRPDAVIHCAATVGGIGANRLHPSQFLTNNVLMNTNVLMAARSANAKKFIGIGSVCGYPCIPKTIPFIEDEYYDGYPEPTNAAYGLTKRLLLAHLEAERQQYGLNYSFLICSNIYGPGDHFGPVTSHVIPALIRKFKDATDTVNVWGSGTATRDFLYIDDACRGIMAALHHDYCAPVNLGTGQETSIAELVDLIAGHFPPHIKVTYSSIYPDGQPRRVLDISRASWIYAWRPLVKLPVGIERTVKSVTRSA